MRLPKERLAEIILEMQGETKIEYIPPFSYVNNSVPCYAPGGICTNPQMDCINCPKHSIVTYADDRNNPYHSETQVNK